MDSHQRPTGWPRPWWAVPTREHSVRVEGLGGCTTEFAACQIRWEIESRAATTQSRTSEGDQRGRDGLRRPVLRRPDPGTDRELAAGDGLPAPHDGRER